MVSYTIITQEQSHKCFEGYQRVYSHKSRELDCTMKFGIYLPPQAQERKLPAIFFLSEFGASDQSFIVKSGAQRFAAEYGVILINPDTSPGGEDDMSDDPTEWDIGLGTGFIVNATREPWSRRIRMYNYFMDEFQEVIKANFPVNGEQSVIGYCMGGHGALVTALKNPGFYKSVSAFSPIANPSQETLGIKAFTGYFGPRNEEWDNWDASKLVQKYNGPPFEVLVDQSTGKHYYDNCEVLFENFIEAAERNGRIKVIVKYREGYDHGFYFVSTFIGEHIKYHVEHFSN